MRRLAIGRFALGLLALLAVAGCGLGGGAAEQEQDAHAVADALRAADGQGSRFVMSENVRLSGPGLPNGQMFTFRADSVDGRLRNGEASFEYRIQDQSRPADYDMVISGGQLYVKPHADPQWRTLAVSDVVIFIPTARLELLRETALLASAVTPPTLTPGSGGVLRRYVVRPAPDQIEELEGVSLTGGAEQQFLKTASAELVVYLTLTDRRLVKAELHLRGNDPAGGTSQQTDSSIELRPGSVGPIAVPANATPIPPQDLFS